MCNGQPITLARKERNPAVVDPVLAQQAENERAAVEAENRAKTAIMAMNKDAKGGVPYGEDVRRNEIPEPSKGVPYGEDVRRNEVPAPVGGSFAAAISDALAPKTTTVAAGKKPVVAAKRPQALGAESAGLSPQGSGSVVE